MAPRSPTLSPPPDAFPTFTNGDVEIVLTPSQKLRLHSDVLRGASSKLCELLTLDNAAVLSKKALSEGANIRYRLELVDVSPTLGTNPGQLTVIKLDTNGRPVDTSGVSRATMALSAHGADPSPRTILSAWLSAFGALYGREIHLFPRSMALIDGLDGPTKTAPGPDHFNMDDDNYDAAQPAAMTSTADLCDIIEAASTVLDVVDYLQLRSSVLAPLELALLGAEQTLWQSVRAAPLAWVELAARLRSFPIWREAALHVIGGWGGGEWSAEDKGGLRKEVHALCARKAAKFEKWKEGLEQRLIAYRHEKLRWDGRPGKQKPRGKKEHEPDVFYWQAQCMWIQWLSARFREGLGRRARDGGYALYKMIWQGKFCDAMVQAAVSPLTPGGRKVMAEIVDEMKKDLKKMVEGAMVSKLKLDQKKTPAGRLTPFIVELKNAPWKTKEAEEYGAGHRAKRPRLETEFRHTPTDEDDDFEDYVA